MDSFIFIGDYIKQIQVDNLQQVIGNNQSVLDGIQLVAVEECKSFLKNKYDISTAFQSITQHDPAKTYAAGQTVYLNADPYASKTYALNDQVLQSGKVYSCSTAITVAEVFTISHWTLLGDQYEIFYAISPKPIFNYKNIYRVGDQVYWNGYTYTNKVETSILDHSALLQIGQSGTDRIINVWPDDTIKGIQSWGMGIAYSIPANTQITDAKWIKGDNRDQKLLEVCINIAIFKAHLRISPRNIPETRAYMYWGNPDDRVALKGRIIYPTYSALGWLQSASAGIDVTPELNTVQPNVGLRTSYGGSQKLINNY